MMCQPRQRTLTVNSYLEGRNKVKTALEQIPFVFLSFQFSNGNKKMVFNAKTEDQC